MVGSRILIVEDDSALLEMLQTNLQREGFVCDIAVDGEQGLMKAQAGGYALVITDRVMPKLDGLDLLKELRRRGDTVPILMLTSKSEEIEKVLGLELGADDYVTKPFQFGELKARIRAIIRRMEAYQGADAAKEVLRLCFGPLVIDLLARKVTINGKLVPLTALEYDLLTFLANHAGAALTREQILEAVWQTTFIGYEQSVNTAIKRLRTKLQEDPTAPELIHTVRGVGYIFMLESPEAQLS